MQKLTSAVSVFQPPYPGCANTYCYIVVYNIGWHILNALSTLVIKLSRVICCIHCTNICPRFIKIANGKLLTSPMQTVNPRQTVTQDSPFTSNLILRHNTVYKLSMDIKEQKQAQIFPSKLIFCKYFGQNWPILWLAVLASHRIQIS